MTLPTRQQLISHVGRGLATIEQQPRRSPIASADIRRKLNQRDLWLLHMLNQHRVLTTHQITAMAFDTGTAARHRLHHLAQFRILDRFRPFTATGSAPWHYVLSDTGAHALADHQRIDIADLHFRRDDVIRLATSRQLGHLLAVNQFFVDLIAEARRAPDTQLKAWWSERRCHNAWGGDLRPDGYGIWAEQGAHTAFFVEIDLGTEPLDRLVGKTYAYTRLAASSGTTVPVLFQLPSHSREFNLHQALGRPEIPVATTNADLAANGPAGEVWAFPGRVGARIRLAELATKAVRS